MGIRYGLKYEYVAGIPFYTGQLTYAEVQGAIATAGSKGNLTFVERGSVWRFQCGGRCTEDDRSTEIWFDDATSLAPKYQVALEAGLLGVGMWEASHLNYSASEGAEAKGMWDALCMRT